MTQQEYEAKKRECWEEFNNDVATCKDHPKVCFFRAFDRIYALSKEKEAITHEEIEKAAKDYIKTNPFVNSRTATTARESFVDGANFALGKQEKDTEVTDISSKERTMDKDEKFKPVEYEPIGCKNYPDIMDALGAQLTRKYERPYYDKHSETIKETLI